MVDERGVAVGSDIYVAGATGSGANPENALLLRYYDPPPVGGYYSPVNKIAILAPYLALISLTGVFSTILAIRKWRKS